MSTLSLPRRAGERPPTGPSVPHVQLGQNSPDALRERLKEWTGPARSRSRERWPRPRTDEELASAQAVVAASCRYASGGELAPRFSRSAPR
ncbi:hypothetical protein [Streptomyces sp. NPDC017988]|uniref:hypothetical protein n=1 Tax=Streptomyces sp. NPDC017988 TaxID=3365025 RepID=UPI0037BBDCD1